MFIQRNFDDNFKLDFYDEKVIELKRRTNVSRSGGIQFKPIGKSGGYIKPQTVVKRDEDQLKFSESKVARDAVEQFKTLLEETVEEKKELERIMKKLSLTQMSFQD